MVDAGALRSADLPWFVLVSTPAVEIPDRTFNPVGEMGERETVELAQDRYTGFQNVERTVTMLGTSATVAEFNTEATVKETEQTVDLTLTSPRLDTGATSSSASVRTRHWCRTNPDESIGSWKGFDTAVSGG